MEKYLVVWPKSKDVVHINYHYTDFGEIVDYLSQVFPNQVLAIDCDIEKYDIVKVINHFGIDKVAMMVNYENVSNAFKLAKRIKEETNAPVMAYGNLTVRHPLLFLKSSFDAMFQSGDYESAISAFFNGYPDIKNMNGIIKLNNGKMSFFREGDYISPDHWGYSKPIQVPVIEYDKVKGRNRYVLNISRGCPFGCPHCLIPMVEGRKERRRSIQNVDMALADITQAYNHIKIWAANFTLKNQYVNDFCDVMKKYPGVTWECATRIDFLRDEEMLKNMAESGCTQISMGIESLNSGKFIESKQFGIEEVEDVIKRVQKYGINVKGCIMFGIPGQTKQDIIDTLKFLKENNVSARPTVYTPYQNVENPTVEELTKFNRKTYDNHNIEGVSPEQLIQLTKTPYEYESILGEKEKNSN
ncbi:MAG: radical SAM protein [Clostridia bacterium]|nr:radical SAM protein [Clostridia bacterium]